MVFPVVGTVSWRDSYNENRGTHRHTGIDIRAPKMRPVLAPFDGVLGFKTNTFWVYGDNGYKCLGTHLNDDTPGTNDNLAEPDFMFAPNLRRGDRVVAGQLIGYVGNSGDATGPHLHFELFAPNGSLINPYAALKKARIMGAPRLPLLPPSARPAPSEVRLMGCVRGWNPVERTLTLLLVGRETENGKSIACAKPTRLILTLTPSVTEAAGGDDALASVPRDRVLSLYVVQKKSPGGFVQKLTLPLDAP